MRKTTIAHVKPLGFVILAVLAVSISRPTVAFADGAVEGIVKILDNTAVTVWRIDAPEVDESSTDYQFITFASGDQVSVFAGGCVQRGGKGLTWARYVNPVGEGSDKFYHGLISIPGVTSGLIRIQDLGLDAWHTVNAAQPSHLTLGYEDKSTGYADNGYYSHDNGLDKQCLASQNAFVIIAVAHRGTVTNQASSFQNLVPTLSTTMITERVSPHHYTTFADDETGLEIDDKTGVMCVAHSPQCEQTHIGHNGKDHIFPNGFPAGISLVASQFKVFWPSKFITQSYNGGIFDSFGSYGVDNSANTPPPETVHWQNACVLGAGGLNATYQVSYVLKHPSNVFINGAGGDPSAPMPDVCPTNLIPSRPDLRP
jgi:hypothetical protein